MRSYQGTVNGLSTTDATQTNARTDTATSWSISSGTPGHMTARFAASGIPLAMAALLALVAGVLLVRSAHRSTELRALVIASGGLLSGAVVQHLVYFVDVSRYAKDAHPKSFGPGFWMMTGALVAGLIVTVATLMSLVPWRLRVVWPDREPEPERGPRFYAQRPSDYYAYQNPYETHDPTPTMQLPVLSTGMIRSAPPTRRLDPAGAAMPTERPAEETQDPLARLLDLAKVAEQAGRAEAERSAKETQDPSVSVPEAAKPVEELSLPVSESVADEVNEPEVKEPDETLPAPRPRPLEAKKPDEQPARRPRSPKDKTSDENPPSPPSPSKDEQPAKEPDAGSGRDREHAGPGAPEGA